MTESPDNPAENENRLPSLADVGGLPAPRNSKPIADNSTSGALPDNQGIITFHCYRCGTLLRMAINGITSGPCPACATWIEAPIPKTPALPPIASSDPITSSSNSAKAALKRLNQTGVAKFEQRRRKKRTKKRSSPEYDKNESDFEERSSRASRRSMYQPNRKFQIAVLGLLVLLVAAATTAILMQVGQLRREAYHQQEAAKPVPTAAIKIDLKSSSEQSLHAFLKTSDPAEISHWIVGGDSKVPEIEEYLKGHPPFQKFTETDVISSTFLGEKDIRRGIYAMIYMPFGKVPLMPKNPLVKMDTSFGLAPPTLLEEVAIMDASASAQQPQALAVFVKKDDRMLLDWDLFVQTWTRSLAAFRDGKLGRGPMRFRVILSLDHPIFENGETLDRDLIRMEDPLNSSDTIRLQVDKFEGTDSLLGPGEQNDPKNPTLKQQTRTATVDLVRDMATGHIKLDRLVCWELLGVGGTEGNTGDLELNPNYKGAPNHESQIHSADQIPEVKDNSKSAP